MEKTGLVKNLLTSIKNNKSIFLTNSKAYRNYMHVDDLINVIFRMLNTKLKHKIYNIGFENVKLIEILKELKKIKNPN